MAEVIIYVPCFDRSAPRHIVNYGALAVVTALRDNGIDAIYLDGAEGSLDTVCGHLETELGNCLYLGISAFTAQVVEGLQIAAFVRSRRPNLPIVWGGIHASLLPEETLQSPLADYVCVGEGDYTAVELYRELASGTPDLRQVHNLVFREAGETVRTDIAPFYDMSQQTHLAWDALALEKYVIHNRFDGNCPSLGIPVARGCPHRCSFCVNVALREFGYTHYRRRRPEHVEADLAYLKDRLGIGFSFIRDEVFFVNTEYSRQIAGVFASQGILWGANLRANYFRPERLTTDFLREMRDAGMLNGAMGIESGSPRVLKELVCKDIAVEQVHHAMEVMAQANIRPFVSFVVGFPTETKAEMQMTLDLAVSIKRTHPRTVVAGIYLLRPYPGAPIYERCLEHGLKVPASLEEWGSLELTRQGGFSLRSMPWLAEHRNLYAKVEYTSASLLDVDEAAGPMLNAFVRLAKLRRAVAFYALPFELWIYRYVRAAVYWLRKRRGNQ